MNTIKQIVKTIIYYIFPPLKDYHRFTRSLTNHVSFKDYLMFYFSVAKQHWGGYIGPFIRIAK